MPADNGGGIAEAVPGPHPEPPDELHDRRPAITDGAGSWLGIHPVDLTPIYFGGDPSESGKFGVSGGEYGIMYAAEDEYGAFGRDAGFMVIDGTDLLERGLANVSCGRRLRVVNLTGGLSRIGVDAACSPATGA